MELMQNIMLWSHVLDVAGDAWHISSLSVVLQLSALSIDLLFLLYFHSLHHIPSRLYIDSYTIWSSDPTPIVRGMPRTWAKWETTIGAWREPQQRDNWPSKMPSQYLLQPKTFTHVGADVIGTLYCCKFSGVQVYANTHRGATLVFYHKCWTFLRNGGAPLILRNMRNMSPHHVK